MWPLCVESEAFKHLGYVNNGHKTKLPETLPGKDSRGQHLSRIQFMDAELTKIHQGAAVELA